MEFTSPAYQCIHLLNKEPYVWEDFALQEANMRSEASVERQLFWYFSQGQAKRLVVV